MQRSPAYPGTSAQIDWLLAGRTDLGIAVSESTKAFMVSRRRLPPDRIRVVFNGAPLEEFRLPSAERVQAERARLGLRRGEPVVGTVGRLDAQKGITYFLKAAALVLRHRPDVRFVDRGRRASPGTAPGGGPRLRHRRPNGVRRVLRGHSR